MGLSKRGAPWSVVKPKSPLASISRVASAKAPSSTSKSGAAPSRRTNGASRASAHSATAAREGDAARAHAALAVPAGVGGERGLRGGVVGLCMARLEVDADEQLGEDPGRKELEPGEDAEEPEREERPAPDALAEELQRGEVAEEDRKSTRLNSSHITI